MIKLSGMFNIIRKISEDKLQQWSQELIDIVKRTIEHETGYVKEYVNQLRKLNPSISNERLVDTIILRRSLKAGGLGAVFGFGGVFTMPITMPSDLYYTFKIQARMVLSVAYIYGWNIDDEDTITDILLVMGGSAGIDALRGVGIKMGQEYAKKIVEKHVTREVMKKINKILSRKIITKAGGQSIFSFTKLVPVVAAPIAGDFNYLGTKGIGRTALIFYKG